MLLISSPLLLGSFPAVLLGSLQMLFLLTIGMPAFGRSVKLLPLIFPVLLLLLLKFAFERGGIDGSSEIVLKGIF